MCKDRAVSVLAVCTDRGVRVPSEMALSSATTGASFLTGAHCLSQPELDGRLLDCETSEMTEPWTDKGLLISEAFGEDDTIIMLEAGAFFATGFTLEGLLDLLFESPFPPSASCHSSIPGSLGI
jgi:hypothetical protein